jgi:Holliday junction resolvase RusA-like endonuclease
LSAVAFIVPFAPVAWQRAGVTWTNQGPKHFTKPETRDWKKTVAVYARSAMRGAAPLTGPLKIELAFQVPIPPSWPNWKREAAERGEIAPTVKPDLDNFEKAVKDAMNGIVWVDDAQVVRCEKAKDFSARPGVAVTITPLSLLPAQVSRRPPVGEHHAQ